MEEDDEKPAIKTQIVTHAHTVGSMERKRAVTGEEQGMMGKEWSMMGKK